MMRKKNVSVKENGLLKSGMEERRGTEKNKTHGAALYELPDSKKLAKQIYTLEPLSTEPARHV